MNTYTVLLAGSCVWNYGYNCGFLRHVEAENPLDAFKKAHDIFIEYNHINSQGEYDLNEIAPMFIALGRFEDICPQMEDVDKYLDGFRKGSTP